MTERSEPAPHLLLVLGESAPREDALHAAVALAARLSAELDALFIEDEDVLRAAALPSGSRVVWGREEGEPFGVGAVLRDYRALAERARAIIEREARSRQVPLRFRVTRGARQTELSRALDAGALVMFGAARAPRSMAPAKQTRSGAPVRVWVDGSEASLRALDVAVCLANASHPLEVWMPPLAIEAVAEARQRVRARVGGSVPIRENAPFEPTREEALRILAVAAGGTLVVPEHAPLARAMAALSRDVSLPCWVVITS